MTVSPPPTRRTAFLPFSPPLIGEEEIAEVVDTLRSNWITTGPKTKRFETDFAAAVRAPGALALNSCTAALHTALVTLGIGPGDEVITTPTTFVASVNVIEHVGARPVLADVTADTLNIDPERVAAAISPRTRAIIPVHFAGHPVDLDAGQYVVRSVHAHAPRKVWICRCTSVAVIGRPKAPSGVGECPSSWLSVAA